MAGTTTNPIEPDPDYPPVVDEECPPDYVGASFGPKDDLVCLPPCGPDDACPSGATGNATGACALNPLLSYAPCTIDTDCPTDGEVCLSGACFVEPPTHCVLFCDDTTQCPDAMECIVGVCSYPA